MNQPHVRKQLLTIHDHTTVDPNEDSTLASSHMGSIPQCGYSHLKEQQLDAFHLQWITVNTVVNESENLIYIRKQYVQLCLICYSTRLTGTV